MEIIGVDTGGTFTDLVYYDGKSKKLQIGKVPSTPSDPSIAVRRLLEFVEDKAKVPTRVVHGTTVATNILLEGKGAQMAVVNTQGFRDLLEIGRTRRMGRGLFDTRFVKVPPLVTRSRRLEISERILADGTVARGLKKRDLAKLVAQLEELDPEVIVICLLNAYRNPRHEEEVAAYLRKKFARTKIVVSSELVREYREYERLSTAVINGFVLLKMESYLQQLEEHVQTSNRRLYVMGSNGGIMTAGSAAEFPARTILSGPAGGVNGALLACEGVGVGDFITCDMGGTSTDVSLVRGYRPAVTQETLIAGLPLKMSQLDINTVGAGGGSIAWIDIGGALRVGPHSAGAEPGPACCGGGGQELTVTDADFLLGRLGMGSFLSGEMKLDRAPAEAALARLADKAGYDDIYRLAEGVIRLAVARMVSAIREISIERGHDPRELTLVGFGGAGPVHVAEIAAELGIDRAIVPMYPGNLSAIGLTAADIRYDFSLTYLEEVSTCALDRLRENAEILTLRGIQQLAQDGFCETQVRIESSVDMRYRGQAFELNVPFDIAEHTDAQLTNKFEEIYRERYGFSRQDEPIQFVALRVVASGLVSRPEEISETAPLVNAELDKQRPLYWRGNWIPACPVIRREALASKAHLAGPVIVEEFSSTTLVPPGWTLDVDERRNLRLELVS